MFKSTVALLCVSIFFAGALVSACGGDDKGGLLSGANTQPNAQASQTNPNQPAAQQQPSQQQQAPSNPAQPPAQPNTSNAPAGDPCALLSKQDAMAILGGAAVKDAHPVAVANQNMGTFTVSVSACDYDASTTTGSVSLQMWKAAGGSDAAVKQMGGIVCGTKEKIAGIGDSACWYSPDHKELQAFKGGSFVSLTVRGAPGNADDAIKALAKRIVDRVQ